MVTVVLTRLQRTEWFACCLHVCVIGDLRLSTVDSVYYPIADLTKGFMLTASIRSV